MKLDPRSTAVGFVPINLKNGNGRRAIAGRADSWGSGAVACRA